MKRLELEWNDFSALLVALNVFFVIAGYWWAPIFGLINNSIGLGLNIKDKGHFNLNVINASFIVLNIYFLLLTF